MKVSWKYFLLAALVFLLAGCGRPPVESTPTTMTEPVTETTQPATDESEPASEPGIILVDHVSAVLTQLSRGDTVEILGEQENCYIVDSEKGQGLLEKRLVRTSGEANYETWTGYAKYGALLHQTYHLTDDGGVMSTNTKVQVLEDLIWCYLVQVEDTYGFVATDQISKQPLRSSSGSDEGGGNGGGSSGGGPSFGQDGGDISLTAFSSGSVSPVLLSNHATGTVIADGAELCVGYYNRNDTVKVTQYTEDTCAIYCDGVYAFVPRMFVRLEKDPVYETWTGYARWNAGVYQDYHLYGDPVKTLQTNAEVTVIGDLGYCYLIETEGEFGMMRPDEVSRWKYTSGSGSSDGDGGSSDGSSSGDGWTPPML